MDEITSIFRVVPSISSETPIGLRGTCTLILSFGFQEVS